MLTVYTRIPHFISKSSHVLCLALALLLCGLVSCGGSKGTPGLKSGQPEPVVSDGPFGIMAPSSVPADSSHALHENAYGFDAFKYDIPVVKNASADDVYCVLDPDCGPGNNDIDGIAFACYRFQLGDDDDNLKVSLNFLESGDFSNLWIGLSDFTNNTWDWKQPNIYGVLETNLERHINPGTNQYFVMVLVMGDDPWRLYKLSTQDYVSQISGNVFDVDGNTPLIGTHIVFTGPETFDCFNSFNAGFRGFVPNQCGEYTITPYKIGYEFDPPSRIVNANSAEVDGGDFTAVLPVRHQVNGRLVLNCTVSEYAYLNMRVTRQDGLGGVFEFPADIYGNWTCELPDGYYFIQPCKPTYSINQVEESEWTFTPERHGFSVSGGAVTVDDFIASQLEFHRVDGNLFSEDGHGIRGGVVDIEPNAPGLLFAPYPAVTDINGYWSVMLPSGEYLAHVYDGYADVTGEITPSTVEFSVNGSNVRLDPFIMSDAHPVKPKISGYVFEEDGVTPVPGVSICRALAEAVTDVNGYYEIRVLYNTQYSLEAHGARHAFTPAVQTVTAVDDVQLAPFIGTPLPAYGLTGFVYEQGTNAPVGSASIEVYRDDLPFFPMVTAVTGNSGFWDAGEVAAGQYTVRVGRSGGLTGYDTPVDGPAVQVVDTAVVADDILLEPVPTYSITGWIYAEDGYTPMPGVVVDLDDGDMRTATNADGSYRFDGLRPGWYTVEPQPGLILFGPGSRHVEITSHDLGIDSFHGTPAEGSTVTGMVYGWYDGNPVEGVRIHFQSGALRFRTYTDSSGQYRVRLPGDRSWVVFADGTFGGFYNDWKTFLLGGEDITLAPIYQVWVCE